MKDLLNLEVPNPGTALIMSSKFSFGFHFSKTFLVSSITKLHSEDVKT